MMFKTGSIIFLFCIVQGSKNTLHPGDLSETKLKSMSCFTTFTTDLTKQSYFKWILSTVLKLVSFLTSV